MIEILMILLIFMIIGSVIAVESRHLLAAIISVGAVGLLLSIVFLMLGAPELAITQVVVEVISLIVLIRATVSREVTDVSGPRELFGIITAVTCVVVITLFGVSMFEEFPAFGVPVMERITDAPSIKYLASGLEDSGTANIVTAILLDFRAYDTLGEVTVLFCAIIGALAILRKRTRKTISEIDEE